jgi:hypothetical protein
MKSFLNYLKEDAEKKKYAFKFKIAGDLPEHCEDVLETALQKFQVSKFTKGKSTPIQREILEFPNVRNLSMTIFEVELDYPATSPILAEIIASSCGIDRSLIRVRTPMEEQALSHEAVPEKKDSKALLSQDYEKGNNQGLVGEKYISGFLKDLAKASKENQPTQVKGINDKMLAKNSPKSKAEVMPKVGPAKSLFASTKTKETK